MGATLGPSATVGGLAPSTGYSVEVEAVDAAGNRSGRSAPLAATTADPPAGGPVTFIAAGGSWSFLDDGSDPGPTWTGAGFDDSGWAAGLAELGFGDGDEATALVPGHVTYNFRHAFTVVGAATVSGLTVDLLADDGAVV